MFLHHHEAHLFFQPHLPWHEQHATLNPRLLQWIAAEQPAGKCLLDVGCGSGRLTLAVAPLAAVVVGIDRDRHALALGQAQARAAGLTHVYFVAADAETTPYAALLGGRPPDMVIAHLCMSPAILQRAHAALPPGGCLVFAALHRAQWQETGRPSRFAFEAEALHALLREGGWHCEAMELDSEVVHFARPEDLDLYFATSPLRQRWQQDGRWQRLVAHLARGGECFTARSHLLVKARKC
ncbi:MAG: hypothetical protein KatS3mg131_3720 [Candidatus Tectimicrobiota bacterium]|nr:MAG: hypothetical protein KatS3mg131_3720 [Candidatus Tectomicrobia bacterium]